MKYLNTIFLKLALICVFGNFALISSQVMGTELSHIENSSKNESRPEVRKHRRKKVMMCHECGKPETQCECEGEGHGIQDEKHDNHDDHDSGHSH